MKYLAIDFETTGTNPAKNAALSFCGIVDYYGNKTPIDLLPRFHCYFIHDEWTIHYRANQINKALIQRLVDRDFAGKNYIFPEEFKLKLGSFLDENGFNQQVTIAGKNPAFDRSFAEALGVTRFSYRMLDPAILYTTNADTNVPGLATCLTRIGASADNVHDEAFDAESVIKLIRNYHGCF